MSDAPKAPQFQSEQEWRQIAQALAALSASPQAPSASQAPKPWRKGGRKLSPARLYEHLSDAAALGALEDVRELLALGAPLTAASAGQGQQAAGRRHIGGSALRSALNHQKMDCAALILRQPHPLGPGVSSEGLWRVVIRQGSLEILREFSSPASPGWPSLQGWLDLACHHQRMELIEPLTALCPEPLSSQNLDRLAGPIASALQWAGLDEAGSGREREFEQASALLERHAERVSEELVRRCFLAVIQADNPAALRRLLELGLRPGARWALQEDGAPPVPLALLAYAQARPKERSGAPGRCFELLSALPPVMEAARAFGAPPLFLSRLSWAQLQEIERMGMDIGSCDEDGDLFAHFWARESASESLPKLKALLKERPELMRAPNHDNITPLTLALQFYPAGARQELRKAFVSLEKRELKHHTQAQTPDAPPKARPRL